MTKKYLPAACAAVIQCSADSSPPVEIELIPAGSVQTRMKDSRDPWKNADAAAVIAATNAENGGEFAVNFDHKPGPAAGWVDALTERAGAIFGKVTWTDRAAAMLSAREYRYISPEFLFDQADRSIKVITGAALTNDPALYMRAIAGADGGAGGYVAAADYDALAASLEAERAGTGTAAATAMVDQATREGKLAPAMRQWALEYAVADPAGFRKYAAAAPVILKPGSVMPTDKTPTSGALSPAELAVCERLGMDPDKFAESKNAVLGSVS